MLNIEMIISLLSTPRTGSRWYSHYIAQQHNALCLFEFFNVQLKYLKYEMYDEFNRHLILDSYIDGCFYRHFTVQDGYIQIKQQYSKRNLNLSEELDYRMTIFKKCKDKQNIVIHNQVYPLEENLLKELQEQSSKNIYIYRKDKKAQLASYIIASATKEWTRFINTPKINKPNVDISITDIDKNDLKNFVKVIQYWDTLDKTAGEVIAYEDMPFTNLDNLPKKQNLDYKSILSQEIINYINLLVDNYAK